MDKQSDLQSDQCLPITCGTICFAYLDVHMCRKDEQLANAVSWLGPDSEATPGDRACIIFHALLLMNLEKCERIYSDAELFRKS